MTYSGVCPPIFKPTKAIFDIFLSILCLATTFCQLLFLILHGQCILGTHIPDIYSLNKAYDIAFEFNTAVF